jgi:hypothetical protein
MVGSSTPSATIQIDAFLQRRQRRPRNATHREVVAVLVFLEQVRRELDPQHDHIGHDAERDLEQR